MLLTSTLEFTYKNIHINMQGEVLIGLYLHIYLHSHKILNATHGGEEKITFCDLKESSFTNNFPPCVVLLAFSVKRLCSESFFYLSNV